MPRFRIYPYRQGSRSAMALANALGGRVLKLEGSRFRPRRDDIIINWGSTSFPRYDRAEPYPGVFNSQGITNASNKRTFFENFPSDGTGIVPKYWTNSADIPDEEFPIVCRTVLAGHSGEGIVIADNREQLVPAPLYVKYIKKQSEYRVHVGWGGEVISVQRKALREGFENPNWKVRNLEGGFVYVRNEDDDDYPLRIYQVAHEALAEVGLDFGAVDVIWNERQQRSYVLEINTAPGLVGQTVQDYANYFLTILNEEATL
jgi:glutathione synthase/RimK-type ligase-like ATP-grasp enzyme